ncbi:MAG: flagellar filament capping protein FliD [Gammaproteobacteria bacterium]|nr:flagellar filament capping protein FliD [Gammaproteobacteria bacterium]
MAISAAGVGSGLDINGIVSQLMALERQPINKLESNIRGYESQLSAYGKISSALSSFETAMEGLGSLDKFKVYSAISSDEDVLSASTTSEAAKGTYDIEISRLAQRHKMASDESADTATFTGDLTVTIGADSLTINPAGKTLEEIRDLINNDTDNPGVTASIINVDTGQQRLVLTSEEEGFDNRLQLSGSIATSLNLASINQVAVVGGGGPGGGGPPGGGGGDEITYETITDLADLDASFSVDGFDITSASNQASSVIDGITFELKSLGTATLNIDRDTDEIEKSVEEFVEAYNNLYSTLNDVSNDELQSDSTVRSIQSAIRNVYNSNPVGLTGTFSALIQVGLNTDSKTGELSLDSSDLQNALDLDFQSVADLFANDDQGMAFRLGEIAGQFLDNNGIVKNREENLQSRIDDAEDDIFSLEARMELKEAALRSKFASLDSLIGSMQGTMSFVSQLGSF